MNLAQCKALHNPQSCRDLRCGRMRVIAGHSPSQIPCRSSGGFQSGAKSVPTSDNKLHSNFLYHQPKKIAHSASSKKQLRLPLSFESIVAFSSSLKFFRFGGEEESREPSPLLRSIDFQGHGDATKIFLEDTLGSAEDVGGQLEYLVNGSEPLQSVDNMSSFMSLAAESSGKDAGTCMERVKPVEHMSRPLIQNFVKLRSFWKRENSDREELKSSETGSTATPIESCQFIPSNCGCHSCEACCSESAIDSGNVAVTPHTEIARNKEYFAKFLYRVPSAERKRITQMAHISNLAYRIPTIEAGNLLRHHNFRLVTSSFELKASALASGNGKDATLEEIEMKSSTGGRVHDQEEAHSNAGRIDEGAMASLNPAAGYAMAATAASCNAQACDLLLSKGESDVSRFGDEIGVDIREDVDPTQICDDDSEILDKDMGVSNSAPKNPWYIRTAASILKAAPRVSSEDQETEHVPQGCPCEWFACENDATSTLVIGIQGTETLAAWQANLQFEPTQFEPEANTGVMVHRGIYEAAKRLYEEVLPCISAHMERNGENGRFQFTGHSLGGSLAMLLSLMVVVRSTAPVSAMLPVYTFGSPCIMCGGNHLLAHLGLPHSHIRSIIMHMDIVPRTFACDYPDHVTVVLKRVSGTFRNHTCLLQQRLIYAPMGEMVIMQPEEDDAPGHPLLPQGSGLYSLRHPSQVGISGAKNEKLLRPARELQSAERAFLNVPHPLEILSDRNAYGSEGTISRDHDCRNYLKFLQRMRRNELRLRRRALTEFRGQLWSPPMEDGSLPLGQFYTEPENYSCFTDRQPLGLESSQYRDLENPENLKSTPKNFPHFSLFRRKRSGPSSKNERTTARP